MTKAERSKKRYDYLKSIGRCCNHPERPVAVGRSASACVGCLDKHRGRMKKAVEMGCCRNHPDRPVSGAKWCVECCEVRAWGNFRRMHGIGKAEYMVMYDAQNGLCAICSVSKAPVGSSVGHGRASAAASNRGLLVLDHCHATGKHRQLLCSTCNVVLGLVYDRPERLQNMIGYLRAHGNK